MKENKFNLKFRLAKAGIVLIYAMGTMIVCLQMRSIFF